MEVEPTGLLPPAGSQSLSWTTPSWLAGSRLPVRAGLAPDRDPGWLVVVLAGWLTRSWLAGSYPLPPVSPPGPVSTLPLSYPKKWQFGGGR